MKKAISIDCVSVEVVIETSTKEVIGVVVHTIDMKSIAFGNTIVDDRVIYPQ